MRTDIGTDNGKKNISPRPGPCVYLLHFPFSLRHVNLCLYVYLYLYLLYLPMNWYVIYTKPKCEDSTALQLRNAGIETLNPKIRTKKYIRGKYITVIEPLFPELPVRLFRSGKPRAHDKVHPGRQVHRQQAEPPGGPAGDHRHDT